MDFFSRYLHYNAGNMAPRMHHMWSALSILAMAVGRRVFVDHKYYQITPMLYICLVGTQGIRKGTAKDLAQQLFLETFPDYPLGASVMTREQIVCRMAEDDASRTYTDETGALAEFRPMAFFINELKNFMSVNPGAMIEFLTDIYDRPFFSADTIRHGLQPITKPYLNILACETPAWIIDKLKLNIISGGFSRRMLYVYETLLPTPEQKITFPFVDETMWESREWCKQHLLKMTKLAGPFIWAPGSKEFFDEWFKALPTPEDEVLAGFYIAKDTLAQKISMLVAIARPEPKLEFTKEILQTGIAILESIEENLPKLTTAAGRNVLAVPQQKLLEILESKGGMMTEKLFHYHAGKMMSEIEYASTLSYLKNTDQLFGLNQTVNGKTIAVLLAPAEYKRQMKNGNIKAS